MKRILFIFSALSFTLFSMAQDLQIIDPVDVMEGSIIVPEDAELDVHWDVMNMTTDTLHMRAKRIQMQIVPNSKNRFCWGPLCYDYPTNESSTNANLIVTMDPGATESTFHGYYEHQGYAGHSIIKYCFFDHFNPDIEVCQTVNFCVDDECIIDGVSEIIMDGELGDIGPNPLTGLGTFSYSFNVLPTDAKVVIYNLVGKQVKSMKLDSKNGIVFLNGQEFQGGVYFYTLEAAGKVFATKKLVISK